MKTLRDLGQHAAQHEAKMAAREFLMLVKFKALAAYGGKPAAKLADEAGAYAGPRVVQMLNAAWELDENLIRKTASEVGSISGWGSALSIFEMQRNAFLNSVAPYSAFDALWPNMLQVPPRTKVPVVTTSFTGSGPILESGVKPITSAALGASDVETVKATGLFLTSQELLKNSPQADSLLRGELERAAIRAANSAFLPLLVPGVSLASSGFTALGVRQDLRSLLQNVTSGSDQRLFWIMNQTIAEALTVLPTSTGAPAFPEMLDGKLGRWPVVACDEATSGEIILIDGSQVAAASENFRVDISTQTSIQMDSAPDSPPGASTILISCWQQNAVAVKIERWIGAKLMRSTACAKITGINYTGNSPL